MSRKTVMSYFFDNLDDYELTHKLHKIALLFLLLKKTWDALKRILERDFRTQIPNPFSSNSFEMLFILPFRFQLFFIIFLEVSLFLDPK